MPLLPGSPRAMPAAFALVLDEKGYALGAPAPARLVLKNESATPLWLNRRMRLGSPQAPRFARELWLDLRAPDGKNLDPRLAELRVKPTAEDFGLLAPGEEQALELDLREVFGLELPGRYAVRANYADGLDDPPPPPTGARTLREHLQTMRAAFTVRSE